MKEETNHKMKESKRGADAEVTGFIPDAQFASPSFYCASLPGRGGLTFLQERTDEHAQGPGELSLFEQERLNGWVSHLHPGRQ